MSHKKSVPVSWVVGIVIISLLLGGYIFNLFKSPVPSQPPEQTPVQSEQPLVQTSETPVPSALPDTEDEFEKSLKTSIKSTKELPEIASVVLKEVIGVNAKTIPNVTFLSNDGEYASVSVREIGVMGGYVVFLVKRQGTWNVVYKGNGYGECSEILPIRKKYAIKQSFLPCVDEL